VLVEAPGLLSPGVFMTTDVNEEPGAPAELQRVPTDGDQISLQFLMRRAFDQLEFDLVPSPKLCQVGSNVLRSLRQLDIEHHKSGLPEVCAKGVLDGIPEFFEPARWEIARH